MFLRHPELLTNGLENLVMHEEVARHNGKAQALKFLSITCKKSVSHAVVTEIPPTSRADMH